MQLGIDSINKVITIYDDVNLRELFDTLKKLNIDKDEWTLEPYAAEKIVKEFVYIPTYKPYQPYVQPSIPWIQPTWNLPTVWCGDNTNYKTTLTVSN
jgi:hypothetical protein